MKLQLLFAQRCCALLFITLFATAAFSQKIKIGLQGGINYASLQTSPGNHPTFNNTTQAIFRGQVNLFLEQHLGALPFSVSAEPGVVFKGYSELVGANRIKSRLRYMNVPLVFNYYPVKQLGISIGTEYNYLFAVFVDGEKNRYIQDYLNRVEIAGLAGIHYRITKKWTLGARYTHGITPVRKIDVTDAEGNPDGVLAQRNWTGQVFVRYVLN